MSIDGGKLPQSTARQKTTYLRSKEEHWLQQLRHWAEAEETTMINGCVSRREEIKLEISLNGDAYWFSPFSQNFEYWFTKNIRQILLVD